MSSLIDFSESTGKFQFLSGVLNAPEAEMDLLIVCDHLWVTAIPQSDWLAEQLSQSLYGIIYKRIVIFNIERTTIG